jgi:type IV pilus assembly protein PilP
MKTPAMNKHLLVSLAMAAPLLLGGCGPSEDDLQEWMRAETAQLKGKVSPLPPVSPFVPVSYFGRDMSDPFAPKRVTKLSANAPDAKRKKDFLESFPLDRLVVVGTIQRKGAQWGLIKTPDGVISMVRTGDYLGQNFGQVVAVTPAGIKLKEAVLDPQGEWASREFQLDVLTAR